MVGREGFEPSKAFSQRIYSPLHLATLVPPQFCRGADDPTRTDDRLITNQLLYPLSYIGSIFFIAILDILSLILFLINYFPRNSSVIDYKYFPGLSQPFYQLFLIKSNLRFILCRALSTDFTCFPSSVAISL